MTEGACKPNVLDLSLHLKAAPGISRYQRVFIENFNLLSKKYLHITLLWSCPVSMLWSYNSGLKDTKEDPPHRISSFVRLYREKGSECFLPFFLVNKSRWVCRFGSMTLTRKASKIEIDHENGPYAHNCWEISATEIHQLNSHAIIPAPDALPPTW